MLEDRHAPTPLRSPQMAIVAIAVVIAIVYEHAQGRVWWCACGKYYPISLDVHSMHNSQHFFDPYSLTHILHGFVFCGVLWLFRKRISLPWRATIAALVEIAWEMTENSAFIIDRYRHNTVSLGYTGDSIANSMGDVASFAVGFIIARKIGLWRCIAVFFAFELLLLLTIRDNLTLNVLMLLWPIDAIRKWQAGG